MTTYPINKSDLFRLAHVFHKLNFAPSLGPCLQMAWAKFKLIRDLKSGIAYFSFIKANGERREAIGTLREGNFNYSPKGADRRENPNLISYWDIEKQAFRSCDVRRLA